MNNVLKSRLSLIVRVNVVLYRTVLLTVTDVLDSEDDYSTGCQNVGHCQQKQSYSGLYVHPDDQTQPTFEMTPGFKPFT